MSSLTTPIAIDVSDAEQAQLVRMLELQRFAEFGRLSAHLIHEVANPLTAAALHLELLDENQSNTIKQIRKNIRQLELYVNAARKQLKAESKPRWFRVSTEVNHCLAILRPIARRARVRIVATTDNNQHRLYGDPIKFNQIVANIAVNAIDAYSEHDCPINQRKVVIGITSAGNCIRIKVQDWAGGIPPDALNKLFEPFYTTKSESPRGLGIGLSLVKQHVEQEFKGSITVKSLESQGTVFTVRLKSQSQLNEASRRAPAWQLTA